MLHRAIDLIGDLLARKAGVAGLTWLAIGAGDPSWDADLPSPSPTAAALKAELFRVPLAAQDFTVDNTKRTLSIAVTISGTLVSQTIREWGIFGGDATALPDTGYLFSYHTHAPVAPSSSTVPPAPLQRQVTFTFNMPNLLAGAWSAISALLQGSAGSSGVTAWAEGSGDPSWDSTPPAANPGATALHAEVLRKTLAPGPSLQYDAPSHSLIASVDLGYTEAAVQLRESGLFAGSQLIAYQTYAVIDKRAPQILHRRFQLELSGDHLVAVPNLANGTLAQALTSLAAAGLVADPVSNVEDSTHAGQVMSFEPAAAANVPAGSRVAVTAGIQPLITVPNVAGLSLSAAQTVLAQAGLKAGDGGQATVPADEIPGGVWQQTPGAGARVVSGTAVLLTIGIPANVPVPNLTGLTASGAALALERADLTLAAPSNQESDAQTGTVIAQSPTAGSSAARGSAVEITLAALRTIVTPDLTGKTLADAETALLTATGTVSAALKRTLPVPLLSVGKTVEQVSAAPAGTIVAQTPLANAQVPWYTTLQVSIAEPQIVAVPSVLGLTLQQATATLQAAKLVAGTTVEESSAAAAGSVLGQSLPEGFKTYAGTAVDLTLAAAILVTVPSIVGLSVDAATETIQARGLVAASPVFGTGSQPDLTVIAQAPPAGTQIPLGGPVTPTIIQHAAVASVIGMQSAAANSVLAGLGLVAVVTQQVSDQPIGSVVSQNPVAGAQVLKGSSVNLVVAEGVAVPNMVGHLTSEFDTQLNAGAFQVTVSSRTPSNQPVQTVLSQAPAGGTVAPQKTVIQVTEASGKVMPNLNGMTAATAKAALTALQLLMQPDSPPTSIVTQQDKATGSEVPLGTTVTVTLTDPSQVSVVPNIVGKLTAAATTLLTPLKLTLRVESQAPNAAPINTILSQSPLPGVSASQGTVILVVASRGALA